MALILVKNQNFGQKSKFYTKISHFGWDFWLILGIWDITGEQNYCIISIFFHIFLNFRMAEESEQKVKNENKKWHSYILLYFIFLVFVGSVVFLVEQQGMVFIKNYFRKYLLGIYKVANIRVFLIDEILF